MPEPGILAVWNNRDAEIAAEYERWYVQEHLPERLAVPGFHFGRRYQAVDAGTPHQFFTYYETHDLQVLSSPQYKACLTAPSAWTKTIMAHWRDMVRALAARVSCAGPGLLGAYAVVARIPPGAEDMALIHSAAAQLWAKESVLGGEVWQAAPDLNRQTTEADLRDRPDANIGAALILHLPREQDAVALLKAPELTTLNAEAVSVYQLLCDLRARH